MRSLPLRRKTTCEKHDLVQSGKSSLKSWPDVKLIPQTNIAWDMYTDYLDPFGGREEPEGTSTCLEDCDHSMLLWDLMLSYIIILTIKEISSLHCASEYRRGIESSPQCITYNAMTWSLKNSVIYTFGSFVLGSGL